MAVEYWHAYVARQLRPLIDLRRADYAAQRATGDLNSEPVEGVVEWTLPYGMDDGNGLVRLTVFTEVVPDTYERRIRVVVAAAARGWHQDNGRVALPRFTEWGAEYIRPRRKTNATADVPRPDGPLTRGMAEALCTAVGGLPDSLREEPGGEFGFAVAVRDGS
ncbi:hypothetical protein H0H10_09005 [Streptomyces sp. TRM S81-3]|uniref:Uncharacterized protein n=1 Tax=Streptomyces griseicoloratus TaxID=2752516 RepID=A0A926L2Y1_9ACTN|nr:hypothetical protein [Streptomyces griseicoloratus]MBD0419307.1 hypothetical protein [Streptomyces griseicoloratus]